MDNQFPLPGPVSTVPEPSNFLPPVVEASPLPSPEEAAPPPPGYQPPASANPPSGNSSPLKVIAPIAIGVLVIGLVAFLLFRILGKSVGSKTQSVSPTNSVTLTYFGLWEPSSVMKPVIDAFERQNPNIKIDYQLQSPQDYQDRVKTALSAQTPPDVVRLHTTWLPLFSADLLPAPPNTLNDT